MRVAVVTTSYPSFDGDPAGHFVQAEVAQLERDGHDVSVITPLPGGAFGWPGVAARLRQRPVGVFEVSSWIVEARRKLKGLACDRIVAHWAMPCAFPIATTGGRSPLEVVSHGGDVRMLVGMPRRARSGVVRAVLARASSWRFVSRPLYESLVQVLEPHEAKSLEAMTTIAPSPLVVPNVDAEVRARRDELGGRRLYVCAGRLVASKHVDKVIDYVASARTTEKPTLIVLGDGPERPRLEAMARAWAIDIRFLGTLSRRETLGWIGAADEVVHASRAEGLSTVVREAEQLGVPVTVLP